MTATEIDRLKREAWRQKKATGEKHNIVLNRLAQERGFKDWPALVRSVDEGPVGNPNAWDFTL